jgi:hypothetical protein
MSLSIADNYLQERVFCNILAAINPYTYKNEDLIEQLPNFVYSSLSAKKENFPRVYIPSKKNNRPKTSNSTSKKGKGREKIKSLTIEEQIERDIRNEIKKLKMLSNQKENEVIFDECLSSRLKGNIDINSSIGAKINEKREEQANSLRPITQLGISKPVIKKKKERRRQYAFSDFTYINPSNPYVPSEYDYILFDEDEDNRNQRKHNKVPNYAMSEEELEFQNFEKPPEPLPKNNQPKLSSNTRPKYTSQVYKYVFKPKPKQARSESEENIKKILFNQYELTTILSNQLSKLNKKRDKALNEKKQIVISNDIVG